MRRWQRRLKEKQNEPGKGGRGWGEEVLLFDAGERESKRKNERARERKRIRKRERGPVEKHFRMRLRLFLVGRPISSYFYNGRRRWSRQVVPSHDGGHCMPLWTSQSSPLLTKHVLAELMRNHRIIVSWESIMAVNDKLQSLPRSSVFIIIDTSCPTHLDAKAVKPLLVPK